MDISLPIRKSYQIYALAKQINDKRDFFIKEEKKIIDKFNAQIINNEIQFKDIETRRLFELEHENLMKYEIDDIDIIELSFEDFKDAQLTALDIAALDGIINFVD
jgi:hypothetical protein